MSTSIGSIPQTPSIVLSRTGNKQKNAMNETFWRFPIECRRITEIGNSAGGGIARQYSTCGIANRLDQSERPIGIPSTIPIAEPIAKPSRIRIKLGTMSRNCENSHRSWNWARIVDGGGQNRLSASAPTTARPGPSPPAPRSPRRS